MFSRLAYGMSHATNGRNASWQMVLPLVHPIDLGSLGSHNRTNIKFSSMVIHIWLGGWGFEGL